MSEPTNPTGKASRTKRRQRRTGGAEAPPSAPATVVEAASALAAAAAPRFARATEPTPYAQVGDASASAPEATHVESGDNEPALPPNSRQAFADWLRQARQAKGLSLEQMAQTTRIQARVLACLEAAQFDALHADVFVRGYLRSYAQCVGLDATAVLQRYAACGLAPGPVAAPDAGRVGTIVSAATTMRFGAAPSAVAAVADAPVTPAVAAPSIETPVQVAAPKEPDGVPAAPLVVQASGKMPRPHLVIDDANPDLAERARAKGPRADRDWGEGGFSSPFLRGEKEPKQTGLTLAVIVLLVAATIALSYLMKTTPATRGVTAASAPMLGIG
ncbi:MAG: helix-turn-helix domain-containing protein [Myxococcales bacterium]|nr:helix-turn-helix domain-containing protein [Myxococcales bacterium]